MRYAVIGTGAIGGYYGSKLNKAGNDVHFLLHSDYDYVKEHGLQVNSCEGSFHLDNPSVYCSTDDMPACDVIIVALKTTNNCLLRSLLPPLLNKGKERGSSPLLLLIQNGIGVEEDVQKMFPELQIAAGLAFICSAKTSPGRVDHLFYGKISIGNYSCKDRRLVEKLIAELKDAGIETYEVEYDEARWKKAVWNMPFNGMTVVLNTQTDMLLADESTEKLIREQMKEVIGVAHALGVRNIDESFVDKMIGETKDMIPYSPSMKLDYEYKRKMEIEYIYDRPIAKAHQIGFAMPRLEMLASELKFKENQRMGEATVR